MSPFIGLHITIMDRKGSGLVINHEEAPTDFNLQGPVVLLGNSADLRHWVAQVGSEGPVNVGLQLYNKTEPTCSLNTGSTE